MIFSYRLHIIFYSLLFITSQARATTGGVPTSDAIHSSIVNIAFEKTVCSGVVIGENTVLTAAHCGSMGGKPLVVAYIQNKVKTSECNKRNVVDYVYEPTAKKTSFVSYSPDILLLKMEAPLCDARIATLSLDALQTDDVVSLAGHGLWQAGHAITTQIEAKIINFENVASLINTDSNPKAGADIAKFLIDGPQNYIFAIPETKNSSICPGDSGGPVFTESENGMILKGINGLTLANELLGSSTCGNAYVQLFTPIYPYLDWIKGKMQEWK